MPTGCCAKLPLAAKMQKRKKTNFELIGSIRCRENNAILFMCFVFKKVNFKFSMILILLVVFTTGYV
jgi:hypothetical protein